MHAGSVSPVLSKRRKRDCYGAEGSPNIEHFSSPPTAAEGKVDRAPSSSPVIGSHKLKPRSLAIDFEAVEPPSPARSDTTTQLIEESNSDQDKSLSETEEGTQDLVFHSSDISVLSSQAAVSSQSIVYSTPEKSSPVEAKRRKEMVLRQSESARKKKHFLP